LQRVGAFLGLDVDGFELNIKTARDIHMNRIATPDSTESTQVNGFDPVECIAQDTQLNRFMLSSIQRLEDLAGYSLGFGLERS
jgi:hypothetical protein